MAAILSSLRTREPTERDDLNRPGSVGHRGGPAARRRRATTVFAWMLFAPAVLWVAAVTIAPIGNAILYSFYHTSFASLDSFAGFDNYVHLFTAPDAVRSFTVTAVFAVSSLVASVAISLGLALMLNRRMRGISTFRTLLMLPWVTSTLLAALLWKWVISPLVGPLPAIVQQLFGVQGFDPLATAPGAMATLIFISVWKAFPFGMVLLLASLRSIPVEYIEAARMDGAGAWQQFRYITVPSIKNTLLVVTVYFSLTFLTMAEIPLVLTGGGPAGATTLAGLKLYQEAFQLLNTGSASALAVVLFVINAVLGLVYVRGLRTDDI